MEHAGTSRRIVEVAAIAALLAAALAPAVTAAASLSVEGGTIVLGRSAAVPVLFRIDEPPGSEILPLRLSVNVGRFSEPARLGPGRYRATYTPPTTQFPQVALVAVWRETGADARIDFLRMPLFGRTRIEVTAEAGAEVRARVGLDTFGPAVADRRGHAEIPIHVEPGVHECAVVVREGSAKEATHRVKVEVPPYNRLTAALVPHAVVADGRSTVRVDVLYDMGGAHPAPERIRVRPSLGKVTFERGAGGLYTYRYVPPPETPATNVTFEVSVEDDPAAHATATLALGLPPPARVVVSGPARRLRAGSGAREPVSVLVLDAAGMGLPGLEVTATAAGKPLAPAGYRGGGQYEFTAAAPEVFPPGGRLPVRARASGGGKTVDGSVELPVDAPPIPSTAIARIEPSIVPADGRTEARIVVEVRDAAGLPLDDAQLQSFASHGTLGAARGRGSGAYELAYVPPAELPQGGAELWIVDASRTFERRFPIPLRPPTHRLSLGIGGGYTRAPGDASGPRIVGAAWAPVAGPFGVGLSATYGTAAKTVHAVDGALSTRTTATFVPLALALGVDVHSGRRVTVTVGGGAALAWAEFTSSISREIARAFGAGWLGFGDLRLRVGPGQAVLGLSYGSARVSTARYQIDPLGLSATLTYRLGIL
jgi:hypothetical protein